MSNEKIIFRERKDLKTCKFQIACSRYKSGYFGYTKVGELLSNLEKVPTRLRVKFNWKFRKHITYPFYLYRGAWMSGPTELTFPEGFGKYAETLSNVCSIYRGEALSFPEGFGQNAIDMSWCFFMYRQSTQLKTLTIPEGCGQKAENLNYCFGYNSAETISLPSTFGQKATTLRFCFEYCTNLKLESNGLPQNFGAEATDVYSCFMNCTGLQSVELPYNFAAKATSCASVFLNCSNLSVIYMQGTSFSKAERLDYFCQNCTSLSTLYLSDGFGAASTNNTSAFAKCTELTTIEGNPQFKTSVSFADSTKLTVDSLMVVINGLQTVTETQTLTLGTTNLAKLTDEQKQIAYDKGWTLA